MGLIPLLKSSQGTSGYVSPRDWPWNFWKLQMNNVAGVSFLSTEVTMVHQFITSTWPKTNVSLQTFVSKHPNVLNVSWYQRKQWPWQLASIQYAATWRTSHDPKSWFTIHVSLRQRPQTTVYRNVAHKYHAAENGHDLTQGNSTLSQKCCKFHTYLDK